MSRYTYTPNFKVPPDRTKRELYECFERWEDADLIRTTNLNDGWGTAEVVFEFHGKPVRVAYGRLHNYAANLRAIFMTLDDLRMSYHRGLGDILTGAVAQMLQLEQGVVVRDPYEVLGVRPDSPIEVIEAAYKAQARRAHPDAGGSDEAMREVNAAMERIKSDRAVPA